MKSTCKGSKCVKMRKVQKAGLLRAARNDKENVHEIIAAFESMKNSLEVYPCTGQKTLIERIEHAIRTIRATTESQMVVADIMFETISSEIKAFCK